MAYYDNKALEKARYLAVTKQEMTEAALRAFDELVKRADENGG